MLMRFRLWRLCLVVLCLVFLCLIEKQTGVVSEVKGAEQVEEEYVLWTGGKLSVADAGKLPFVEGMTHQTIQRATRDGYKFLHGAAIIEHQGVMFAHWANSPVNENGPEETLQGRRSKDGGKSWGELEVIGPGFKNEECHSHGVWLVQEDRLWAICSRFGLGTEGKKFPGLHSEAFVLNPETNRWESRGQVMKDCWPFDEPMKMANGNYLTGGLNGDAEPVVAVSAGAEITRWKTVPIPYPSSLKPGYAETTVWGEGTEAMAIIRGGAGVAWVSRSDDCGESWTEALPSNLPMPRAKAYLGKLSNGQLYLISNLRDRNTLVISVGEPGEWTVKRMWQIRHGESEAPRFPGRAKSKQWSYPYGYEYDGKLYVVYSIGKEDCGLSILPLESLKVD